MTLLPGKFSAFFQKRETLEKHEMTFIASKVKGKATSPSAP